MVVYIGGIKAIPEANESYAESYTTKVTMPTPKPLFDTGAYTTATGTHTHTWNQHQPQPPSTPWIPQPNVFGPMEGLDDLCQLLQVEPTTDLEGLFLQGTSAKQYSLVDVLAAQLSIMEKLHVLLVHRRPALEPGE